jgi:hypothetical protein
LKPSGKTIDEFIKKKIDNFTPQFDHPEGESEKPTKGQAQYVIVKIYPAKD